MRIERRGHPFDGMELRVVRRSRTADGMLRVHVEHPSGGSLTVPATWTHLEARKSAASQTRGRVQDYRELRELREDLKDRLEHEQSEGSRVRIAAGSDRLAGGLGALGEHSRGRPGEGGGGSREDAAEGGRSRR